MDTLQNLSFCQIEFTRDQFSLRANLTLTAATRYVLLAPSGSGKSTLLDLIAGFLRPTSGQIKYGNQIISSLSVTERPISYLFQQYNLFEHLTIEKNFALINEQRDHIYQALHSVGLSLSYLKKYPKELSGGEQQRAALARTLLLKRPIMLLDEPFSALDTETKNHITGLTLNLQKQQGWLLVAVSHDPLDVQRLQAKTLVIKDSTIQELLY